MGSDDALRLYLTGGLAVEGPAGVIDDARLAGRQGRLALAHLTLERRRPVPTAELAEVLWPEGVPRAWDTRRPLLAGDDAPWIEEAPQRLGHLLVRALDCLTETSLACGDPALAIRLAEEADALQPFRVAGYRQLMRAQLAAGQRAEAVRVYERCRTLLAGELGVDPAPDTERVYLAVLRGRS